MKTFNQARTELMDALEALGYDVSRELKVPHATAPGSGFRVFFKPQGVYAVDGKSLTLARARSMCIDIRDTERALAAIAAY